MVLSSSITSWFPFPVNGGGKGALVFPPLLAGEVSAELTEGGLQRLIGGRDA